LRCTPTMKRAILSAIDWLARRRHAAAAIGIHDGIRCEQIAYLVDVA
jgi:hypothetical protein